MFMDAHLSTVGQSSKELTERITWNHATPVRDPLIKTSRQGALMSPAKYIQYYTQLNNGKTEIKN
jgi:hypothetical protein